MCVIYSSSDVSLSLCCQNNFRLYSRFVILFLVMCWAGSQTLSPLSPAHSSPSQARHGQGLGVGSGLAWDFRSPSRRPRPRLTAISYFSSTFRMAISTCGLRLLIMEDLKKGLKPEWDLIKLDNSVKLPHTLCTWPQTLQCVSCPSPHRATYLLLIVQLICINQHKAHLCQMWGWVHSKWPAIVTLMSTFNVFYSCIL